MMIRTRSSRRSVFGHFDFSPPIFEWQNTPSRFFEMIHTALDPIVPTGSLRDYEVQPSLSLGEVFARFNIIGGENSISLYADRISAEFPVVFPNDTDLILRILQAVHTDFNEKFPEQVYSSVRISLFEHAEVVDGSSLVSYLSRYSVSIENSVQKNLSLKIQPAGRISVVSDDGNRRATCTVEKSEFTENALFVNLEIKISTEEDSTFITILDSYWDIVNTCMSILDLQLVGEE